MIQVRVPRLLSRIFSPLAMFSTLSLPVLLAGCGGASFTSAPTPTVTITSSPAAITAGGSSTLTVAATNATSVTVTGSDGSTYTMQATGGTQAVSPTATTTYTANAANSTGAGTKASATATVTVTTAPPPPAPTVTITASPTSITAGGSSTLTVVATNATAVTVTGTDGSTYTLKASGGTQAVSPTATTTYTANATGAGGKVSAGTTVTVTAVTPVAPTVAITASPTSITAGSSSTLTVGATNATGVTVTGTDGSTYTLQPAGGTQAVSPTATTTYTATATGAGGKTTATATVTVTPAGPPVAPTVSISANPTSIASGSSSTLTVAATNATGVTVTGTDGSTYTLPAAGGTQAVSPTVTTTYTATATGAGGKASAGTTVTVAPAPTVSIAAKPTSIVTGGSSTLTVIATNATGVTVTGTDGSTYTLQPAGGTQPVNPTATTTYTATATGAGGKVTATAIVTVTAPPAATVTITAAPTTIFSGGSSTLTVVATNATAVTVTGTDGSSYTLQPTGGTQMVSPTATTTTTITYTASATGSGASATATATVTVNPAATVQSVNHVIFMLQENHTFDDYFGMLNPYRKANNTNGQAWNVGDDGKTYNVDGIDDKLNTSNEDDAGTAFKLFKFASTCIDDDSSDWLASYGDVNRYDFATNRPIEMNGFVHTAEGFATSCNASGSCSGNFTDLNGQRAMGYYDQGFLNYYYYMASQFAVSNRWFSPVASKSIDNRIATFTGGTTQGLVADPGGDDHLSGLNIPTIFQKLDQAKVSWKIYYTVTEGFCLNEDECSGSAYDKFPATDFSNLTYAFNYLTENPSGSPTGCTAPLQPSSVVGDASNSFCIDPNKIAPLSQYYSDLTNGTLPSFAFIEAGYANNDEHPGSGQSVLAGQYEMSQILNAFMTSSSWNDSVFFFAYDEGGGPYDHVPPVPGHSNDNTDASLGTIPDISTIAVNADSYIPCVPAGGVATIHCDLHSDWPGAVATDAPAVQGFAAQLGFRLPNFIISPFTRRHYVSNIPMDHTAILKFVEDRFIGDHNYLTARDAAQPNLLDFFDFNNIPWATPPVPPAPVTQITLGYNPCTPTALGP
jgi:phospholipase C